MHINPLPQENVTLLDGIFKERFKLNHAYLLSLETENLTQNFLLEAVLTGWSTYNNQFGKPDSQEHRHYGWESPTHGFRGHFLGHWLSAASMVWAQTSDGRIRLKINEIIDILEKCQEQNGGQWLGSFSEKHFRLLAEGKPSPVPHYVTHKTLMGLYDVWRLAGNEKALQLADRFADWFVDWCKGFSREQMNRILEVETGGMLEAWADLYSATQDAKYLDLIEKYTRYWLYEPLLEGKDPLTNAHANKSIADIQGAARVYEVTGNKWYRQVVEAFWECAVTNRGMFCTGSNNTSEWWNPPFQLAARRNKYTQEHCTVYNMIRIADYLYRWSGDVSYLDYIERNIYNGFLAQQNPETGMISYWLPLQAGGQKRWGHPTKDFWCCHGSLVQAHCLYNILTYYKDPEGYIVAQYIPTKLNSIWNDVPVSISQQFDWKVGNLNLKGDTSSFDGPINFPRFWKINLDISAETPVEFTLKLRMPEWLADLPTLIVNGREQLVEKNDSGYLCIRRLWHDDQVTLLLPKTFRTEPLPDEPETVAFLDGPVVLAGICHQEITLYGNKNTPDEFIIPDNELDFKEWNFAYRTIKQPFSIGFKPLYEIVDEIYTVYFPVEDKCK